MGGCRCSYRNCSVKSSKDEIVHMFHFPVFDKPRCHQWITNAQKLNFLNLKLSQLRNRVICEHHFKDSEFMNFTKGKLKRDAIPTEDGPYCKNTVENDDPEMCLINLDDIENDHLTKMEKRAHFSVKYGDFLMNDVTDQITVNTNPKTSKNLLADRITYDKSYKTSLESIYNNISYENTTVTDPISSLYQNSMHNPKVLAIEYEDLNHNTKENNDREASPRNVEPRQAFSNSKQQVQKPVKTNSRVKITSEKKLSKPVKIKGELKTVSPSLILKVPNKKNKQNVEVNNTPVETCFVNIEPGFTTNNNMGIYQTNVKEQADLINVNQMPCLEDNNLNIQNAGGLNDGIHIISHYVLDTNNENTPLKLEPDAVIDRNREATLQTNKSAPINSVSCPNMSDIPILRTDEPATNIPNTETTTINIETPTNNVLHNLLRTRKRKIDNISENNTSINLNSQQNEISEKLKSVQNITLIKPQPKSPNSLINKTILRNKMPPERLAAIEEKRKYNMKLRDIVNSCLTNPEDESESPKLENYSEKLKDKKVGEHLLSDSSLPSSQENIISYLEARLKRMEDTLLNKINQNSNRIADLKRTIKPATSKKSTFTQTYTNLDTKRHLYQQISQYLTPEANSLIYEELFINKYSQNVLNSQSQNKRKNR